MRSTRTSAASSRKGYKVAVCDQMEDARFAKGLVRREVTRVVSPGTVVEDRILGGPDHSFLASLVDSPKGPGAFSVVDITTGEWFHGYADGPDADGLVSAIAPFQPREILWNAGNSETRGAVLLAAVRREFRSARVEPAPAPISEQELPASFPRAGDATAVGEADRRLVAYLRVAQPRIVPTCSWSSAARGVDGSCWIPRRCGTWKSVAPMNPRRPEGRDALRRVGRDRHLGGTPHARVLVDEPACRCGEHRRAAGRGPIAGRTGRRPRRAPSVARRGRRPRPHRLTDRRPSRPTARARGTARRPPVGRAGASAPRGGADGPDAGRPRGRDRTDRRDCSSC